jgi:toluene monooxygenase system protein E
MTQARKPRPRRTFSAFGDVRRMPSEYEIMTHKQNWTLRENRASAFEQNPSSPANLWFLTYRENSPLKADDWDQFRDPDALTYRGYVTVQSDAEARAAGILDEYAAAGATESLAPGQVALLGSLFTPSRFLVHGWQQIQAYIGYMAPSAYITNASGFAAADDLRRVTLTAYRTRELQTAHPGSEIGDAERRIWEQDPAWQPAREAIERALVAYDWGEAFTALTLVLAPTLDDVLIRQLREVSQDNGDEETWLLLSTLQADHDRRARWSSALARFAIEQRPENARVLRTWIDRWASLADAAALGLGALLENKPERGRAAAEVAEGARAARETFHAGIFGAAEAPGDSRATR